MTEDIAAFKRRLDEQGIPYSDYGTWAERVKPHGMVIGDFEQDLLHGHPTRGSAGAGTADVSPTDADGEPYSPTPCWRCFPVADKAGINGLGSSNSKRSAPAKRAAS